MSPNDLVGCRVRFHFGTARNEEEGTVVAVVPVNADARNILEEHDLKLRSKGRGTINHLVDRLVIVERVRHRVTGAQCRPRVRLVPFKNGRFTVLESTTVVPHNLPLGASSSKQVVELRSGCSNGFDVKPDPESCDGGVLAPRFKAPDANERAKTLVDWIRKKMPNGVTLNEYVAREFSEMIAASIDGAVRAAAQEVEAYAKLREEAAK